MLIIPIYKKVGLSCLQSYKHLKKKYKKVGHLGTIDKYAEGILVVLTDEDTKKVQQLIKHSKSYIFTIIYGLKTNTDDVFGDIQYLDEEYECKLFHKAITQYIKKYQKSYVYQVAPKITAKKFNGKSMYKIKDTQDIEKYTLINILDMRILNISNHYADIYVEAKGGIYIRSIAREIGYMANSYACAANINRTSSLNYKFGECINTT